jgi:hypothetical protein
MISNERPLPYDHHESTGGKAKSGMTEATIKAETIQIEKKTFVFSLKENPRGRFLRITEGVDGHRGTIIVPASGLEEFKRVLDAMNQVAASTPSKTAP